MRLVVVVVCVLLFAACHVGYKSAAGSAQSPKGYGDGVTRTLQFADEGFVLSRLGLGVLGGAAAVGSIESSTIEKDSNGNLWHVVVVDKERAKNAQGILDTANDPNKKLSNKSGGLAARLQIAARTLGGDTSGWQYDMGYNVRRISSLGPLAMLMRAYFGFGYGSFTMHDRVLDRMDRGPPERGTADSDFLGIYARGGIFLSKVPRSFKDFTGFETFVTLSGNALGPSTVGIGERLQWTLVFVEVEALAGPEGRTYSLEAGLGF